MEKLTCSIERCIVRLSITSLSNGIFVVQATTLRSLKDSCQLIDNEFNVTRKLGSEA